MRQQEVVEEVTAVVKKRVVSESVTCDLCGAQSLARREVMDDFTGVTHWLSDEDGATTFDATTVAREQGSYSPYGGRSTIEAFNICPACWPRLAAFMAWRNHAEPTRIDNAWGDEGFV